MLQFKNIIITTEILKYISEMDEFKGKWQATQDLAPDRLNSLKRIATIESVGSSTRIEGAKLTDEQVEKLLSKLEQKSFILTLWTDALCHQSVLARCLSKHCAQNLVKILSLMSISWLLNRSGI